jgi:hypothetical protein
MSMTDLQGKRLEAVPACRADLARRQPPQHRVHGAAAAVGFLTEDPHELPPQRITDDPCEATVGDRTHDVEVLDVEQLVLARRSALPSGRYIVCVAFRTCSERSMPEYVWTKGILGASSAPNRAWPMS